MYVATAIAADETVEIDKFVETVVDSDDVWLVRFTRYHFHDSTTFTTFRVFAQRHAQAVGTSVQKIEFCLGGVGNKHETHANRYV